MQISCDTPRTRQEYFSMRRLLIVSVTIVGFLITPLISAEDLSIATGEFAPLLQEVDNPLLAAGATIRSENVDQYSRWLDEAVVESVRAERFQITLGPQLNFPTHPRYLKATEDNLGATAIGRAPGDLSGYLGGRPFTDLDTQDPQAGIKAAWNMRYAYAPDETETARFIWRYRDMKKDKLERTLTMYGAILRYTHRHSHDPVPSLESNPSNLFSALYLRVSSPQDIRNTQLLIHRAEVDTEPEQAWMYLNTQRRVNVLGPGKRPMPSWAVTS